MSEILLLDGKRVELRPDPITRSLRIADVSEAGQRKSSFSYTIKVPKTLNNMQVFDMLAVVGNTSRKPYTEIKCDYISENIYLVSGGIAVIREGDKDNYFVNIIDGFKSLEDLLADKLISDLDLDEFNHPLTAVYVVNSQQNTEGLIYAFADFGKGYEKGEVTQKVEKLAPCLFLHTILDKIKESIDVLFLGDFWTENTKYKNELITPAKGYEVPVGFPNINIRDTLAELKQIDIIKDFANKYGLLVKPVNDSKDYIFEPIQSVLNDRASAVDWSEKLVSYKNEEYQSGYAKKNIAGYSYAENANNHDGIFEVDNENAEDEKALFTSIYEFPAISGVLGVGASLPGQDVYKLPIWGDEVTNRIQLKQFPIQYEFINARLKNDGSVVNDNNYLLKKYEVEIFDTVLQEYKFYAVKGAVESTGDCLVYFFDENDDPIIPQNVGTGVLEEFELIALIPVPTNTKKIFVMGTTSFSPNLFEWQNYEYLSAEKEEIKSSLMGFEILACQMQFQFFDTFPIIAVQNVPFITDKNQDLQYSVDNYYNSFNDLINSYKKVKFDVNLNVIDIYNHDFFILKYFAQTSRYYYLNSIQYTANRIAKVEALEIQDFAVFKVAGLSGFNLDLNSIGAIQGHNKLSDKAISKATIKKYFSDKENLDPSKVKIISGFDDEDIEIRQNDALIRLETEIDFSELNLVVSSAKFDGGTYEHEFTYNVATSRGLYAEENQVIKVKATNTIDYSQAKRPSADIELASGGTTIIIGQPSIKTLSAKDTVNYEGEEVKNYDFTIIQKPTQSTAKIDYNGLDYFCRLSFDGVAGDLGTHKIRLVVTTASGLTDYQDKTIIITEA